jgi:predicted Fe-Mo cluster-binding NifX family protein
MNKMKERGMKIAVATVDGETVSQHFGHSRGFIVFETEGATILGRQLRTPDDTPHNQGVCHGENGQGGGALEMLAGCEVLICGGMGGGAATALQGAGIRPVLMPGVASAKEAVTQFLEGKGDTVAAGFCQCDHH